MNEELKILDLEEKTDTFQVVFEVPGDRYGQNYPKRLTHSFPLKQGFFEETESGVKRWEKVLRENYLKSGSKSGDESVKEKVKSERENVRGKRIE